MKPKSCFPNLLAEIARRGLTISGMAAELGRARDTLSRNFNGSLRIDEALRIRDRLQSRLSLQKRLSRHEPAQLVDYLLFLPGV